MKKECIICGEDFQVADESPEFKNPTCIACFGVLPGQIVTLPPGMKLTRLAMFPPHKAGLELEHNPHLTVYETVKQYLECGQFDSCPPDWKDDAARQRAIDTNEIWLLTWFPETPVGSHCVAAPTLDEVLELASWGAKPLSGG